MKFRIVCIGIDHFMIEQEIERTSWNWVHVRHPVFFWRRTPVKKDKIVKTWASVRICTASLTLVTTSYARQVFRSGTKEQCKRMIDQVIAKAEETRLKREYLHQYMADNPPEEYP